MFPEIVNFLVGYCTVFHTSYVHGSLQWPELWLHLIIRPGIRSCSSSLFMEFTDFVRQFQSSSLSCTSVPVIYTTLIFSFCLVRLRKHSQPWIKCTDKLLLDKFYMFECLKGFIIAVWLKNSPKLSKDGKLTVKKGRGLSSFLK